MRIMEQAKNETTSVALETIITNAVKIPGVKVNRSKFLAEAFALSHFPLLLLSSH